MPNPLPPCRTIHVVAFQGVRSRSLSVAFQQALRAEKSGTGPGPTSIDILFIMGHVGVLTNDGNSIYGFHPDGSGLPMWQLLEALKNGDAFPGVVNDDTNVFAVAGQKSLPILSFGIVRPEPQYLIFTTCLDGERERSQYTYGFPNSNGDCNCITWLERLGLPLLTGRMHEFARLPGIAFRLSRRFGECM